MPTNIVLPPLSAWAASRLTGILQSKTQDAFNAAFDTTFAANVRVTFNGGSLSRDEYKEKLLAESGAALLENAATVSIQSETQVLTGNQGQLSGLVGLFYTSTSDSKFLVLGAPTERKASSSLNLVIEPTEKNPQNPNIPLRGYFDPRRVTAVNQVAAESSYHATIPASSVRGPFGGDFGPGPVRLPEGTSTRTETLPGDGEFGVAPVLIPGETIGKTDA